MIAVARPARPEVDDATLVAFVAAGDLQALGELYDRHEPALRRFLVRLGVSTSDADDLVQLVFLEVVHAAARFDPKLSVRAWLFGVATILVRRHRRSIARAIARLVAWAGIAERQEHTTPADLVESDRARQRLQRAFEGLSDKKREAFVLVTLEGLSGEEAARALGVPVNTIWTRLHHARLELRAALGEEP